MPEKRRPSAGAESPLEKPLEPIKLGLLADDAAINHAASERAAAEWDRMQALLEHFAIDPASPDKWYSLALRLAREHLPAFREAAKRGAPRRWDEVRLGYLHAEVDALKEAGLSVEDACRKLSQVSVWAAFLEPSQKDAARTLGPDPAEALRRAYFAGCDARWVSICKDARQYDLLVGGEERWLKSLEDALK